MDLRISEPVFDITPLLYNRSVLAATCHYHEFVKQAWPITEGQTPFSDNWHLYAIAEHLEACVRGEIRNLIVNIPPRSTKTNMFSVFLAPWIWTTLPWIKFMYNSYAQSLSIEHSLKARRLVESDWYQERWGHIFQLSKDQKAKSFFENNKTGYRIASSVGASTTGKGADFLILDDPNNIKDGESQVKRDSVNMFMDQVWWNRLNNPKTGIRIIVQQRSHEQDASAHVMSKDTENEWVKLVLPMEYEERRKCYTVILPSTNGKVWEDPRSVEGELLHPDRFPIEVVEGYKRNLGSYAYAGQYQQRPSPEDGGIIKKSWFNWWKYSYMPQVKFVIQSWDTALTANETSAYHACTTWGIFQDHNYNDNIILLSMWRDRVEYPELRNMAKRLYFDYRDIGKQRNPKLAGKNIDMCLVEGKASGDMLIKDLRTAGIRAISFNPTGHGEKIARARIAGAAIEAGNVWIPAEPPDYIRPLPFADEFLNLIAAYPRDIGSLDVVDTMSQAFIKLKDARYIFNPKDDKPRPSHPSEVKMY